MRSAAVPLVPSPSTLLPFMAPVLAPTWRRIGPPPGPGGRRMAIVAHGYPQDERRHDLWAHHPPGSVVPGTRVPVIPLVRPVHAIVEEQVHFPSRSVVDRVVRHHNEFGERRQVDPDAHAGNSDANAHLSSGRTHRAQHAQQHSKCVAHFLSLIFESIGMKSPTGLMPAPFIIARRNCTTKLVVPHNSRRLHPAMSYGPMLPDVRSIEGRGPARGRRRPRRAAARAPGHLPTPTR